MEYSYDYLDINISPRERKTKADVMTVYMAIKCGKSSKNHKLHIKSKRVDHTKSDEVKKISKVIRNRV